MMASVNALSDIVPKRATLGDVQLWLGLLIFEDNQVVLKAAKSRMSAHSAYAALDIATI